MRQTGVLLQIILKTWTPMWIWDENEACEIAKLGMHRSRVELLHMRRYACIATNEWFGEVFRIDASKKCYHINASEQASKV